MKSLLLLLFSLCCVTFFIGCGQSSRPASIGGAKDAHGCITSAGYRWCHKSASCERPWELADKEGFPKSLEAFDAYCGDQAP
ncbi:hypothetical protein [Hydrogenimonas sp.]